MRRFARALPARVPRRRGYRWRGAPGGPGTDARRMFRDAMRHAGEFIRLRRRKRDQRQRRIVLLIDVSGSMKERTQAHLAFAHALARAADTVEVFTIGTRLTRITRALRLRNREQALATASLLVADWDGGTRIGEALDAFLAIPRFAALARGAAVVVLSDGLERGDPATMADAVARFSRLAWRTVWLTPLAADPGFEPRTAGLAAARPFLDELGNGGSIESICAHVLGIWSRSSARGRHDRDRRRPSPHLAARATCHGSTGRCSRASSALTSRSGAIIRSANISPTLPAASVTRSVYVQANWAKERLRERSRLCAARRRRDRISAGDRWLCRFSGR